MFKMKSDHTLLYAKIHIEEADKFVKRPPRRTIEESEFTAKIAAALWEKNGDIK